MTTSCNLAEYKVDRSDYLRFNRSVWKNSLPRSLFWVTVLLLPLLLLTWVAEGDPVLVVATALNYSLFMAVGFLVSWLWNDWQARKIYQQTASLHEKQSCKITEAALEQSQASGSARLEWAKVHKWDEDEKLLLIYISAVQAFILPKDQVEDGFVESLRSALTESGLPNMGKPRK